MRPIILLTCSFIFSISLASPPIFADTVTLNKQNYNFGDVFTISGNVGYIEGKFIGLQILNPSKSDIVLIDQFFPQKDGSFSKSYKAQGPKWYESGIYTVKLVYDDHLTEKRFDFIKAQKSEESLISKNPKPDIKEEASSVFPPKEDLNDPKLRLQGFPDPNNSPKYYYDRYELEVEYREWFDEMFPDYSIFEIVGYDQTHIPGFPDVNNSPWYYVDRYNNEEIYKDWFDSQFSTKSIYEVLGYPEIFFQKVPDWVKNNAKWWSSDLITDADFLNGVSYLINEKILIIPPSDESGISNSQTIPVWVKSTAGWWAEGKINETEFLKGIQFLVENGIIKV